MMSKIWKPTKDECEVIRSAAGRESGCNPKSIVLQPGWRYNTKREAPSSLNIALVSDDPEWADTDLNDYGRWDEFRRGVELTDDGRAILDFYIYKRGAYEQLEGNVTVYYEAGRIARIHGYPGEYPTELKK